MSDRPDGVRNLETAERWPFTCTPGQLAERLDEAYSYFGAMLPAVRCVFIEGGSVGITAPYAALRAERDALRQERDERGSGWTCFHCDEHFSDRSAAREHFGPQEISQPICQIDAQAFRAMEEVLRRYQLEDTELHREIYRLQAVLPTSIRRAEEDGYAKGLADGRAPLREALRKHGRHIWPCREPRPGDLCKCGLDAALAGDSAVAPADTRAPAVSVPAAPPMPHEAHGISAKWALFFADQDRGYMVFDNETEARQAFERARMQWTCSLYKAVGISGYGPEAAMYDAAPESPGVGDV